LIVLNTKYRDPWWNFQTLIVCKYANRQDKLEQRENFKLEARVVERFGRGRDDKLAEVGSYV
jgi:hypothetical protein